MGAVDNFLAGIFPSYQLRRMQAKRVTAAYDSATPSRTHKATRESRGPNVNAGEAAKSIRDQIRYMEQNTDLINGALDVLVTHVVGSGIRPEPMVRAKGAEELHDPMNKLLTDLYNDWSRNPEVTNSLHEAAAQRMVARSLFRDGEVFLQHVLGDAKALKHRTKVPYSYEMIDCDMVPILASINMRMPSDNVLQGIELNEWGAPLSYWIYKQVPNDVTKGFTYTGVPEVKNVAADLITHLRITTRIRQLRGVSPFASVLKRIADIEDIDESERVAARVAAAMTGFIKKTSPDGFVPTVDKEGNPLPDREMSFEPGMIFDNLRPNEDIGTIQSNRPNNGLIAFRDAQLRMVASAVGTSYSSLSKNYNGTYSAQRQELVEQWAIYGVLHNYFVERCERVKWEKFVTAAHLNNMLKGQINNVDIDTLLKATFSRPAMPWIQPLQEAESFQVLRNTGVITKSAIIRARGEDPREVEAQIKAENVRFPDPVLPLPITEPKAPRIVK